MAVLGKSLQETVAARDPEPLLAVEQQRADHATGEAVGALGVVFQALESRLARVVARQAAGLRADPDRAIGTARERGDVVVADRRRVGGVVAKDAELVRVEAVEAVLRADPDEALLVLEQVTRGRLRESGFDALVREAYALDAVPARARARG